jgi:hypothetical protein
MQAFSASGGEEETDNLLFVDNIQCLPPALKGIVKVVSMTHVLPFCLINVHKILS